MKRSVALLLVVCGCGGSVEAEPAQCGALPLVGWTWERRSGDCGDVPDLSQCEAAETHGSVVSGACEIAGDVLCGADIVTVICRDGVCYAAVSKATCSGEYTLRVATR